MYIPVVLKDGCEELVHKEVFHSLMTTKQVLLFKRSGGWAIVGKDPVRDMLRSSIFTIPERRGGERIMSCERLEICPFFDKYKDNLAPPDYQLIIESYCEGALMNQCARLVYEKTKGAKPPVNMLPSGAFINK